MIEITAGNFFEQLTLLQVRLVDLRSSLVIHNNELPDRSDIQTNAEVGLGTDQKTMHITGYLDIEAKRKGGGEECSRATIHIAYQCVFDLNEEAPEGVLANPDSLARVGMSMMWPHFRELAMSIMGRMAIPQLVLPMFLPHDLGGPKLKVIGRDLI